VVHTVVGTKKNVGAVHKVIHLKTTHLDDNGAVLVMEKKLKIRTLLSLVNHAHTLETQNKIIF